MTLHSETLESLREERDALRQRVAELEQRIQEKKLAETNLRQSEARYRAFLRAIPDLMFRVNTEGFFLDLAASKTDDLLAAPDNIVGKHISEILPPDLVQKTMEYGIRAIQTGEVVVLDYQIPIQNELRDFEARYAAIGTDEFLIISRDITERKRIEENFRRSQSQAEIIQAQEASLAALSTPLLQISELILLLPLIGGVDSQRAQRIQETLLNELGQRKARIVILDITALEGVDEQVANLLVAMSQAVRLLGAQVILTGIQPKVAQTLVQQGVDLSNILTHSTLQMGIAYAVRWSTPRTAV